MDETASPSGGRPIRPVSPIKLQGEKADVFNAVLARLKESGNQSVDDPAFREGICAHFQLLPARYAHDFNIERAGDVLMHKNLLDCVKTTDRRAAFHVRPVHVLPAGLEISEMAAFSNATPPTQDNANNFWPRFHPPAFVPSADLEALALELSTAAAPDDTDDIGDAASSKTFQHKPIHEVTFSTSDKPKILSKLSSLLADVGLNIREAHVFSTTDGFSLDVFVVDGWPTEEVQELQEMIEASIKKIVWTESSPGSSPPKEILDGDMPEQEVQKAPSNGMDDWEIDFNLLKFEQRVGSGSFGDLYKGTYCGQDVAIKVLKPTHLNRDLQREFAQEVSIMRKVRHKNVVQFIGACTQSPNLCIVTEFMPGGSVFDFLHKKKGVLKLPTLIKMAIDVSKGMDYLHQCKIIHRDLKAANLLMDEHEVVKVADFGVARVQDQTGIMTAETGTYRWMAPEVIQHQAYDHKADVFSFGILLWELLTGKLPYEDQTPLQAAVGVMQEGLRPSIPENIHPKLAELLPKCWQQNPSLRPEFSEITIILQKILKEVAEEERREKKGGGKGGGFFTGFKRTSQ